MCTVWYQQDKAIRMRAVNAPLFCLPLLLPFLIPHFFLPSLFPSIHPSFCRPYFFNRASFYVVFFFLLNLPYLKFFPLFGPLFLLFFLPTLLSLRPVFYWFFLTEAYFLAFLQSLLPSFGRSWFLLMYHWLKTTRLPPFDTGLEPTFFVLIQIIRPYWW